MVGSQYYVKVFPILGEYSGRAIFRIGEKFLPVLYSMPHEGMVLTE
jgi:hypothetical protein